jgi:putative membrane protein insertion efficiency factor
MNLSQHILIAAIRVYRWTVSPAQLLLFGPTGGCRFTPTCSQYAIEAIHSRGILSGSALAAKRICRCHPWGECGHDPVPPKKFRMQNPVPDFSPKHIL